MFVEGAGAAVVEGHAIKKLLLVASMHEIKNASQWCREIPKTHREEL